MFLFYSYNSIERITYFNILLFFFAIYYLQKVFVLNQKLVYKLLNTRWIQNLAMSLKTVRMMKVPMKMIITAIWKRTLQLSLKTFLLHQSTLKLGNFNPLLFSFDPSSCAFSSRIKNLILETAPVFFELFFRSKTI